MRETVPFAQTNGKAMNHAWSRADIPDVPEEIDYARVSTMTNDQIKRLSTPELRLRALRLRAGFGAAAEAARAIGVNEVTYQHQENGRRALSPKAVERYAAFFRVSPGLIIYGIAPPPIPEPSGPRRIHVAGALEKGGEIKDRMSASLLLPETVEVPRFVPDNLHALMVCTDDMHPAYRPGDVLLYQPPPVGEIDREGIDGRECVLETEDGELLLRTVHASPHKHLFTLTNYRGAVQHQVRLRWAVRVSWVQRDGFEPSELAPRNPN